MSKPRKRRFSYVYPQDAPVCGERVIRWRGSLVQWGDLVGTRDSVILAPEEPYSVVPLRVQRRWGLRPASVPASEWVNGRIPDWRGVECEGGHITFWIDSFRRRGGERERYWQRFTILALFPRRETQPPAIEALLGSQFFLDEHLRLSVLYDRIVPRFRNHLSVRRDGRIVTQPGRDLDPLVPCGRLRYPRSLPEK